mmetsp:Transcript_32296/g.90907  ORF Transcript_32296/g.90907 Transcript_32296/m.90907 type:complete len:239 (+) Transcript_32296:494-1210(+)
MLSTCCCMLTQEASTSPASRCCCSSSKPMCAVVCSMDLRSSPKSCSSRCTLSWRFWRSCIRSVISSDSCIRRRCASAWSVALVTCSKSRACAERRSSSLRWCSAATLRSSSARRSRSSVSFCSRSARLRPATSLKASRLLWIPAVRVRSSAFVDLTRDWACSTSLSCWAAASSRMACSARAASPRRPDQLATIWLSRSSLRSAGSTSSPNLLRWAAIFSAASCVMRQASSSKPFLSLS